MCFVCRACVSFWTKSWKNVLCTMPSKMETKMGHNGTLHQSHHIFLFLFSGPPFETGCAERTREIEPLQNTMEGQFRLRYTRDGLCSVHFDARECARKRTKWTVSPLSLPGFWRCVYTAWNVRRLSKKWLPQFSKESWYREAFILCPFKRLGNRLGLF